MKFNFSWVSFLWVLLACPVFGQVGKPMMSDADCGTFGTLRIRGISEDGKWIASSVSYESGNDTLYLMHTRTGHKFSYPKAVTPIFHGNFFAFVHDGKVTVRDLTTGKIFVRPGTDFQFMKHGIVIYEKNWRNLEACDWNGKIMHHITGVTSFKANKQLSKALYSQTVNDSSYVVSLSLYKTAKPTIIIRSTGIFSSLQWSNDGTKISAIEAIRGHDSPTVLHYADLTRKAQIVADISGLGLPNARIFVEGLYRHYISEDGLSVFFAVLPQRAAIGNDKGVEIWNGHDRWTYNMEKLTAGWRNVVKVAVWTPSSQKMSLISSAKLPDCRILPGHRSALLSNPNDYEPQYKENGPRDYYLLNFASGETNKILTKIDGTPSDIVCSKDGDVLVYFYDGLWRKLDLGDNTDVALSIGRDVEWTSDFLDYNSEPRLYGYGGFSMDGKFIFLYDRYDIWKVGLTTRSLERVTFGREQGVRYRVRRSDDSDFYEIDIARPLQLNATNVKSAEFGFCLLKGGEIEPIAFGDFYADDLYSANGVFAYRYQRFDVSPQIMIRTKQESICLHKSNTKVDGYSVGKSGMLQYRTGSKDMSAAVFYPPNYDATKPYPTIVHIYEGQSRELHRFVNPSWRNEEGYNITMQTYDGYVVVLPDLNYERDMPGGSAAESLKDLAQTLIAKGISDQRKIGLMGHSFGGYETMFTITQTNLFSAAVAGSGIADTVGWCFSMSDYLQKPEMWRFEDQQFRMTRPFHENKQAFLANNPITSSDAVKTPLLIYSGKEDTNVPYRQSMEFYLSLRRQKKTVTMLLYPDENHVIMNSQNQEDLTKRVRQWFATFLLGSPPVAWIDHDE